jgi:hypothetical protein
MYVERKRKMRRPKRYGIVSRGEVERTELFTPLARQKSCKVDIENPPVCSGVEVLKLNHDVLLLSLPKLQAQWTGDCI